MKITYNPKKDPFKELERIASADCDKCPICGETKDFHLSKPGDLTSLSGISQLSCTTWAEGGFLFGRTKHYKIKHYICHTCGATWDSEPFQYT